VKRSEAMSIDGSGHELGRRSLSRSTLAPVIAREFVDEVLNANGFQELTEIAKLLTSEVVTNAVVHTGAASDIIVERVGYCVRITVHDSGHGAIVARRPEPSGPGGGRGLFIIDQLAARWGVQESLSGHAVWFEMQTRPSTT
jgi:anti-sigma regulatory factor (Ser/Thr protein kinase)